MLIHSLPRMVLCVVVIAVFGASPAKADFFDGARQTLSKDIPHFFTSDVPHFFQDDIPCAFGGQPTSHGRKSCNERKGASHHGEEPAPDSKKDTPPAPAREQ